MAQVRPYRGIEAAERLAQRRRRLLDAGLELLAGDTARPELTVRAICRQSGLAARYFYESFTDKDEFVGAVLDSIVAELAATTQAVVAAAPLAEQNRAGITNIVRTIGADARIGRLLFDSQLSNPVLVRKRAELGGVFAVLAGEHVRTALRREENSRIKATAHFVVGGVAQTISAWLAGDVGLDQDQLVEQLTAILDEFAEPRLYGS